VLALDLADHGPVASSDATAGLSIRHYVDAVVQACGCLDDPPVLVGHSFGGLVAQLAATRCRIDSMILLAPTAPWGVRGATMGEALSALTLHGLGPSWSAAIRPEYRSLAASLFDRLAVRERRATFARLVPESGRALWESLNWWLDPLATTFVDPSQIEVPVFAVAGAADVISPMMTVALAARRLGATVMVFDKMSHGLPAEPGWSGVAAA
jgi:pimeloyl-ACP methyl ester carboxylesterase